MANPYHALTPWLRLIDALLIITIVYSVFGHFSIFL